jgi:hypothetical protein
MYTQNFALVWSRLYKILPLFLILSHLEPFNALTSYFFTISVILASSRRLEHTIIIEVCQWQPEQ